MKGTKILTQKADLGLCLYEHKKNSIYKHKSADPHQEISIINKTDLIMPSELKNLKNLFPDYIFISAKKQAGLNVLKNKIKDMLGISSSLSSTFSLTTARQRIALEETYDYLAAGIKLLQDDNFSCELISLELGSALDSINSLLGTTTPNEIIDHVFSSFCVGK